MTPDALARRLAKLQSILEVAKALAAERDLDRLLALVVAEAAKVADADRCTLFLVDRERGELWSKVAQGAAEIRLPLGAGIAGAVAAGGVAVRIEDAYADPRFTPSVDAETGYRTRTILAVPMRNTRGEVVGVLQALNRREGVFGPDDEELLGALGGPAASAIENALLAAEIERLFEAFVRASVVAIEQRDPSTAGHSARVAALAVALARALRDAGPAAPEGARLDDEALTQLRYAALLHDFGKVGVREHVLLKPDRLSDDERREIQGHVTHTWRFLSEIPWTRPLRRVPEIAYGHHERLDGGGYPRGLAAPGISLESRIIAIADVWDALTASDRPYRKAMAPERALEILAEEARRGQLDAALLAVFVEAAVWRTAAG